ncbi:MAG: hypothetical protein D6805_02505 [Planctomycetota bacterium]|nr:MAG: hypothetical protein D6805_02505 [Planctomycetota bacterium]
MQSSSLKTILTLTISFLPFPLLAQQKFFEKVTQQWANFRMEAMQDAAAVIIKSVDFWKKVATPDQQLSLKKEAHSFQNLLMKISYQWKKNSKNKNGTVWVYGLRKEVPYLSSKDTKKKSTLSNKTTQLRILVRQEKDIWKILKWETSCSSCKGKGVCQECGGIGKIQEKCWKCKGTGKLKTYDSKSDKKADEKDEDQKSSTSSIKCYNCNGTGKITYECWACKKSKGSCSSCNGKGWIENIRDFSMAFKPLPTLPSKNYFNLNTPSNAIQTVIFIDYKIKNRFLDKLKVYFSKIRSFAKDYFSQELIQLCKKEARKIPSTPPWIAKVKIQKIIKKENQAIVIVRGGNNFLSAYFFRYIRGKWMWDNVGYPCWSCQGSGKCQKCKGAGKVWQKCTSCGKGGEDVSKCPSCQGKGKFQVNCQKCKKNPGKCPTCQGVGFQMKRK